MYGYKTARCLWRLPVGGTFTGLLGIMAWMVLACAAFATEPQEAEPLPWYWQNPWPENLPPVFQGLITYHADGEAPDPADDERIERPSAAIDPGFPELLGQSASVWLEQSRLLERLPRRSNRYGWALALENERLVVGAPGTQTLMSRDSPGKAYIYELADGIWHEQAELMPSNSEQHDMFGFSAAISGDTVLVGAVRTFEDDEPRSVTVFVEDGGSWSEQAQLEASLPTLLTPDFFGFAVDIVGDTAVIGAPFTSASSELPWTGAVYVFRRENGIWSEPAVIQASDSIPGDTFGGSVALSDDGNRIFVGTLQVNPFAGRVYEFKWDGDDWIEEALIQSLDSQDGNGFGEAISLEGDRLLVGDSLQQAAYLFERNTGGWAQQAKFVIPEGEDPDNFFGYAVALHDDRVVVGAPKVDIPGPDEAPRGIGAVYSFELSDGVWSDGEKLLHGDGQDGDGDWRNGDWFGHAVVLGDDYLVASAPFARRNWRPAGAVYTFESTPLPAEYAVLQGRVEGLGSCGSDVLPLEHAKIEINGSVNGHAVRSRYDGRYQIIVDSSDSTVDIMVTADGHQPLSLTDVAITAGATLEEDFSLVLAQPCARAEPEVMIVDVLPEQTVQHAVVIDNLDGGADLEWSVAGSALAMDAPQWVPQGGLHDADCGPGPGFIIHDDGVSERTASALAPGAASEFRGVNRFTPDVYPSALRHVCVAVERFFHVETAEIEFDVVIYDADELEGTPGAELGAISVTVDAAEVPYNDTALPVWISVDVSALNLVVDAGSVYIGKRWNPSAAPAITLPVDTGVDNRPVLYADSQRWTDLFEHWTPVGFIVLPANSNHVRSLFIRAQFDPRGCLDPEALPWLGIEQGSGTVTAAASASVDLTFDASGMPPGFYEGSLCLFTNDPAHPLVVVPLELGVLGDPGPGLLQAQPTVVDFGEVQAGTSHQAVVTLVNATAPGADDIELSQMMLDDMTDVFQLAGGSCQVGHVLRPGRSCGARIVFYPDTTGTVYNTQLTIGSSDAQTVVIPIAGEVPPDPPALVLDPVDVLTSVDAGQTVTYTLELANIGDLLLDWSLEEGRSAGSDQPAGVLRPRSVSDALAVPLEDLSPAPGLAFSQASDRQAIDGLAIARHDFITGGGTAVLTHSVSMDIEAGLGVACTYNDDGTSAENRYLRVFDLAEFGIDGPFDITQMAFGVDTATAPVPLTINLYTLRGALDYDNMRLIGSGAVGVGPAQENQVVNVPLSAWVPAQSTLVVEIVAPDMRGHARFRPGANQEGETGPAWIVAPDCNVLIPRTFAQIDFPHSHLVMSVTGTALPLECDFPQWLDVSPTSGSIPGRDSQSLTLTLDGSDLAPGAHRGQLCLTSNDPDLDLVAVPVELEVRPGPTPPAELAVTPQELAFGNVAVGSVSTVAVTVSNAAPDHGAMLSIAAIDLLAGSPDFEIVGGDCEAGVTALEPGMDCTLEIRFQPLVEQSYAGALRVVTGEGDQATIGLLGTGTVSDERIFRDRFEQ